jgi:hypothetical protein
MFLVNQWFIFVIFTSVAPHRGQPAAMCHLRWQPIRRLAVSCGLGRHWIRTWDCRTTVWRATIELPCLPKFFFGAFASMGLVVHEFGRDPAYRVFIYSRMDLHFWGCRAGIRTRDRLTAVRHANLSATPHPYVVYVNM